MSPPRSDDDPYTVAAFGNLFMSPYIPRLPPYPFELLVSLIDEIEPSPGKAPMPRFIGEPRLS